MSRYIVILAAVLTVGCSQPTPDIVVDGVGVKDETEGQRLIADPTFPARFQLETAAALKYAGGRGDELRGLVVVFSTADAVSCGAPTHNAHGTVLGCHDGWNGIIRISLRNWNTPSYPTLPTCFAYSSLAHEIVHVVIGDKCHHDWRFTHFEPLYQELRAIEAPYRDRDAEDLACGTMPALYSDWWDEQPSC